MTHRAGPILPPEERANHFKLRVPDEAVGCWLKHAQAVAGQGEDEKAAAVMRWTDWALERWR